MDDKTEQSTFQIPLWVWVAFWIAYMVHGLVSAGLRGWFLDPQGNEWGVVKFLILSSSYAMLGAAFHIACKVTEPSIIYGRIASGKMRVDVPGTVRTIVTQTMIAAVLIWFFIAILLIGTELRWR
ncbi:MAG TPA: hypothetical protein VKI44_33445 [Acetobacteraceae bacterium]|nr:hypothetical protein [Acetobacteraceae bacterium]